MTVFLTDDLYAGFTGLPGQPLYESTTASIYEVPHKWDVAINGVGFMLDGMPQWRTVNLLRQQQDDREAGELSLNPEGLWRRSASSWEFGAGQQRYDDDQSQRQRFRASKGLDVWTPGELTLLPDTASVRAVNASAAAVQVVSTAGHVYWADLQTVYRSDLTTNTAVTSTPAANITSLVSVGSYVLAGYTSNGVYKIAAGASTGAQWMTDSVTPSVVGWAKGRVIVTVGAAVYNPTTAFSSSAALPAALFTHPDSAFTWVGVAEGTSWIYLGGTSGDKSTVYKTAVKADGTALDIPSVAGRLPDGETLTSIYGYLGTLILGTSDGFRVAAPNQSGDLIIGSLVDLGVAVRAMLGRGTFVYFGWSNYDATSTGVGRINLATLTDGDNLDPAYASDLMITGQGVVAGIAYLNTLIVGVNALGVYRQHATDLVTSGTLHSGKVGFGITEDKVMLGARSNKVGEGTVALALATEDGNFATIGESGVQARGESHELRTTITRASATVGPTVHSTTMYAYPAPRGTFLVDVPVIIADAVMTRDGVETSMNVPATHESLRELFLTQRLVTYQERLGTFAVTVAGLRDDPANDHNDTMMTTVKVYL